MGNLQLVGDHGAIPEVDGEECDCAQYRAAESGGLAFHDASGRSRREQLDGAGGGGVVFVAPHAGWIFPRFAIDVCG